MLKKCYGLRKCIMLLMSCKHVWSCLFSYYRLYMGEVLHCLFTCSGSGLVLLHLSSHILSIRNDIGRHADLRSDKYSCNHLISVVKNKIWMCLF